LRAVLSVARDFGAFLLALLVHSRRAAAMDPLLDKQGERDLVQRWRGGDEAAGDRLIARCLPLVVSIAFEYRRWGIPIEDIVQQGNLGLLRAASKFDPDRDCRLATYAAYWIRAEIRDYVVRGYRVVRLGTTKAEKRALRAYRRTRESDPSALAASSGLTREKAEWLLPLLAGREASLDAAADDRSPMFDRLAGPSPTPEEEATARELRGRARIAVKRALADLTERERLVARERLMSDDPRTLREIGVELGVSKERVRQIEERVRDKLRARLGELRGEAA
jgi:RNA polymerase sigma-32 factor